MSDLAPFVAAAIRDKVVHELQIEVEKLTQEKKGLEDTVLKYKKQYEQGNPYRIVSLSLRGTALVQCRVNLENALEQDMISVFEGDMDIPLPVRDLLQVEVKIGETTACRLHQLSFRTINYFRCSATEQSFIKVLIEQRPDLKIEAAIGPFDELEYCTLVDIAPENMSAGRYESDIIHDNFPRIFHASRLPLDKISKIYFDDSRMSSSFLFEYLEIPYVPSY